MYINHKNAYNKSHKNVEENLNSFINNQERAKRITNNCSNPASSS